MCKEQCPINALSFDTKITFLAWIVYKIFAFIGFHKFSNNFINNADIKNQFHDICRSRRDAPAGGLRFAIAIMVLEILQVLYRNPVFLFGGLWGAEGSPDEDGAHVKNNVRSMLFRLTPKLSS